MAHKITIQSKQRPPDEEKGELTEAAEKLWGDRKFEEAAKVFATAFQFGRAAESLEAAGKKEEAWDMRFTALKEAGSARIQGRIEHAAELYEQANLWSASRICYGKLKPPNVDEPHLNPSIAGESPYARKIAKLIILQESQRRLKTANSKRAQDLQDTGDYERAIGIYRTIHDFFGVSTCYGRMGREDLAVKWKHYARAWESEKRF
ncbi:MAG: hypothetical protein ABH851_06830 [Methanobacteriota archaeon]